MISDVDFTRNKHKTDNAISSGSATKKIDDEEYRKYETTDLCLKHVRCEPVLEVQSVSLWLTDPFVERQEHWEVYGEIYVYDHSNLGDDNCYIYQRGEGLNDKPPEILPFRGGTLSLTGPNDIISMDSPHIVVDIRDKVTGKTLVNGLCRLYKTIDCTSNQNHQFEQFKTATIVCDGWVAKVGYFALTCGVFANVEVGLRAAVGKEVADQLDGLEIYGKIDVEYDLFYYDQKFNINLFEIKEDSNDCERVKFYFPMILSRPVVAIPAYSSVTIKVSLWSRANNELIVQGSCEFVTLNSGKCYQTIPGAGCINAEVEISWSEPFKLDRDECIESAREIQRYSYMRLHRDRPYLPSSIVVQVHSLFIGHQSNEQLSLYGSITYAGGIFCTVFDRDKDDPYILLPGCNLVHLEDNNVLIPGDIFILTVNLNDVEGRVFIKGAVSVSFGIRYRLEGWYDRLLCSVIKGAAKRSFAAVHYTVYSDAIKATLKVHFFSKIEHSTNTCCRIHGSLVAYHDVDAKYRSNYEKLYQKIVLFDRPEQNPIQMSSQNLELELLKSVVAVPLPSPLYIVADLICCLSTGVIGRVRETLKIGIGTNNVVTQGDEFGVYVAVGWEGVR